MRTGGRTWDGAVRRQLIVVLFSDVIQACEEAQSCSIRICTGGDEQMRNGQLVQRGSAVRLDPQRPSEEAGIPGTSEAGSLWRQNLPPLLW